MSLVQSAPGGQAFAKTSTKQVPKISSGVGLHLPASKGTRARPEELAPQEGARPARMHTPEPKLQVHRDPAAPAPPPPPLGRAAKGSGLTAPAAWPGPCPPLCQGEGKTH